MTLKVFISPQYTEKDKADGGIRRVVEAQGKYLPEFGIEPVRDLDRAELLVGHGAIWFDQAERPFISHNHGMYWHEYEWVQGEEATNREVTEALVRAQAVTVPSYWVREALTRGMLIEPEVIYHGVNADEWAHEYEPGNYVLWNKARQDPVSEPGDMQKLAARMPGVKFVSTLGMPTQNVKVCGVQPLPKMKPLIQKAGVYLATARETFGIGTLEALAAGVPVAGWRYGGQAEIIREGETGYLAPYGDYEALAEAVRKCLRERATLSAQGREDVRARWQWPDKIAQYAALYKRVYADWHAERPQVSVIVTCHNLAKFLPEALRSLQAQAFTAWECIIVDDFSTDNTMSVALEWCASDKRFQYVKTPWNLGLSGARNFGFAQARGRYILNLDADDMLTDHALAVLTQSLNGHSELSIVYGRLDIIGEDGSGRRPSAFPSDGFNWQYQMSHVNQLHYAALMRREVWERSGGYREKMWRAEDAEFWCRATSFGFRAAQVTDEPTLIYRIRRDSKGQTENRTYADRDGYWNEGFPWHQAKTGPVGAELARKNGKVLPHLELVPFSAQGTPPEGKHWWPYHRQEPLVSVIIPVGPEHTRYIIDALDCLVAQTYGNWEAVVVNDSGEPLDKIPGAPYARIIQTPGQCGAGYARNRGLEAARAPLVLFLDADDLIAPDTLVKMLRAYARGNVGYVYTDWKIEQPGHKVQAFQAREYDARGWLKAGQHAITVLMATEDARRIGFDEQMPGWEDWDFFVHCAVEGVCGLRVPEPLLTYRQTTGQRREAARTHKDELLGQLVERYKDYTTGSKEMAKCCGGNKTAVETIQRAKEVMTMQAVPTNGNGNAVEEIVVPEGYVRMQFIGPQRGPVTYYANGHPYSGANDDLHRYVNARQEDVARLESMGVWRKVRMPQPAITQPPAPAPAPTPMSVTVPVTAPVAVAEKAPAELVPAMAVPTPAPTIETATEPTLPKAPAPKRTRKAKAAVAHA